MHAAAAAAVGRAKRLAVCCTGSDRLRRCPWATIQVRVYFEKKKRSKGYDFFFFSQFHFLASRQAVVTGVVPFPPRFLPFIFIAHRRVQQSHCSSIFHRVLLTHALALSASQFVHKKKSQRIFTSMHSAGLNSRN